VKNHIEGVKNHIPVGFISLKEAFQIYHKCLWKDAPRLEPLPKGDLEEHLSRSEEASVKLSEAFAKGQLECRVFDAGQAWPIKAHRWREMFSPEHTFFGGSFSDRHPFIDEAIFKKWLGQRKRGRKAIYRAGEFREKALSVLKNVNGIGFHYSQATFKAEIQEWCVEAWGGQAPRETWIKKHLALVLREYEQAQRLRESEQAQR
jgi:hypothetical protein